MPSAAGRFRRAISQSMPGTTYFTPRLAAAISTTIAAQIGVRATIADLSRLPPRALTDATTAVIAKCRSSWMSGARWRSRPPRSHPSWMATYCPAHREVPSPAVLHGRWTCSLGTHVTSSALQPAEDPRTFTPPHLHGSQARLRSSRPRDRQPFPEGQHCTVGPLTQSHHPVTANQRSVVTFSQARATGRFPRPWTILVLRRGRRR